MNAPASFGQVIAMMLVALLSVMWTLWFVRALLRFVKSDPAPAPDYVVVSYDRECPFCGAEPRVLCHHDCPEFDQRTERSMPSMVVRE